MPIGHSDFIGIVAEFIDHIYRYAPCIKQHLAPGRASAEAIFILERYQAPDSVGYDAAFFDAHVHGKGGIDMVLSQTVQAITESLKARYVRWVYSRYLDPLDWRTKCEIAEILSGYIKDFMPGDIFADMPASRFAGHIPDLVDLLLSSGIELNLNT